MNILCDPSCVYSGYGYSSLSVENPTALSWKAGCHIFLVVCKDIEKYLGERSPRSGYTCLPGGEGHPSILYLESFSSSVVLCVDL